MNWHQIAEKIKTGTLNLEHQNHWGCSNPTAIKKIQADIFERILDDYHHTLEYANGKGDNTWNQDGAQDYDIDWNTRMRDHYNRYLICDYSNVWKSGGQEDLLPLKTQFVCFHCGQKIFFYCPDDTKIVAYTDYVGYRDGVSKPCVFPTFRPYGGVINIQSDLIVANRFAFFGEEFEPDCPFGKTKVAFSEFVNVEDFKNE